MVGANKMDQILYIPTVCSPPYLTQMEITACCTLQGGQHQANEWRTYEKHGLLSYANNMKLLV